MNNIELELRNVSREPLPKRSKEEINELARSLLAKMTLEEKIGQLVQSGHDTTAISGPAFDASKTVENVSKGMVGSILGIDDNRISYHLQKKALESRAGIPLFFCADIIHGCRTSFPINLAMSCSFSEEVIKNAAKVAAYESAHSGVDLTFSPMLDLVRDPRWGRVMESNGEDPFLSKCLAKAYVEGYRGDGIEGYDTVACCAKHFVGYGAIEGGREYNTVDMSNGRLHQYYLPPFQSAIESGVDMVMSSFNVYDGIPLTCNKKMLRDVLRDELGFKGVVISDYTSSGETIAHRVCRDEKEVAFKCITAGLDHEMISPTYAKYLKELVQEGKVEESLINEACLHVLCLKYQMGLFDNPFKHLYLNPQEYWLTENAKKVSKDVADKSAVLLENNGILPLKKQQKLALIGPYAKSNRMVGAWGGKCNRNDCETLYDTFVKKGYDVKYAYGTSELGLDESGFDEALDVCEECDVVLYACGEDEYMAGEGNSRAYLNLPGVQEKLLHKIKALNKPVVLIIFAGRPLVLTDIKEYADAILYCWFLGTMASSSITDLLTGVVNPTGKLSMSFPYAVGQIPVYYNALPTGRPLFDNDPKNQYRSHYIDIPNAPLYPFGYGLSYSTYEYKNFKVDKNVLHENETLVLMVDVENTSLFDGEEVVQAYIKAASGSISRPVLELKGFKRIKIAKKTKKCCIIKIDYKDFGYYDNNDYTVEKGKYTVFIGPNSSKLESIDIFLADKLSY